jgi:resuscitation-promoting factor RpfB
MNLHRLLVAPAAMAVSTVFLAAGCSNGADQPATPEASATRAQATPAKRDVVKTKLVRVRQRIAFERDVVRTSALDKGVTQVEAAGRPGVRVRVVKVTLKNGVEVGRDVVKTFVARQPVDRVQLVGTRAKPKPTAAASSCDPNYTGACVPVASDVDCGGGSGDGPAYVDGPVRIVGSDVYDLDRDGDGIACDS